MRMTSGGRVHGKKCAAFQHGWCSSRWTVRSLEENWRVPERVLFIGTQFSILYGTFSSIEQPIRSDANTQLARQTLALCVLGVQPKMHPCVYCCRQPRQRGLAAYTQLVSTLKSPMATCDWATRIQLRVSTFRAVKVLIRESPLMMETP